jgi:hypothetical protein
VTTTNAKNAREVDTHQQGDAQSVICMVATSKVTTRDAKNARKMDVSPGR